jgi:uncharacterized membrane protein YhaH (DUF805 family)
MTFSEAVRTCFEKYATFRGRARRSEFWWFTLFVFLVQAGLGVLDTALFGMGPDATRLLNPLFSLAILLPSLAVSVRRLHDIGRTGWWVLIYLVPVVGLLVLLWWYTRPGEAGANRFGPPPVGAERAA